MMIGFPCASKSSSFAMSVANCSYGMLIEPGMCPSASSTGSRASMIVAALASKKAFTFEVSIWIGLPTSGISGTPDEALPTICRGSFMSGGSGWLPPGWLSLAVGEMSSSESSFGAV